MWSRTWLPRLNTAHRWLAPRVSETVVALDGTLDWGFKIAGPLSGDVRIGATMRGPVGEPERLFAEGAASGWRWSLGLGSVSVGTVRVIDAAGRTLLMSVPRVEGRHLVVGPR